MRKLTSFLITATFTILLSSGALAQTTFFTYQGNLVLNGQPATGNYDFEFLLFDSLSGGTQIDITNVRPNLAVSDGVFTTTLAFQDAQESTADRYLEIRVRPVGGNSYTTLTPRTWMTSAPTAMKSWYSHQAGTAQNALSLGGVAANQYVLTGDPRLSDARNPLPNSANYIQNGITPQANSNFTISGTGTANILNALTQFNIGGQRVLAAPPSSNTFVGLNSGQNNSAGFSNTFVGTFAGQMNTGGDENSFFGKDAGISSTGNQNTFIGTDAGQNNTTGSANTALGYGANVGSGTLTNATAVGAGAIVTTSNTVTLGRAADTVFIPGVINTQQYNIGGQRVLAAPASANTFVGLNSGQNNSAGFSNTFVGTFAGQTNTGGDENSFFGKDAGISSTGNQNTFIGTDAGQGNTSGSGNSALGAGANVSSGTLTNATAIGAGAVVTFSDTIQLGRDTLDSVRIGRLGSNGITAVCLNGVNGFATCSSSARYKTNITDFRSGIDVIRGLRPVTFNWTAGNALDLGLVAEEVAGIDPLLVTYNDKGEVEGVKYDRIGVVLINTVKEQMTLIERQQKALDAQAEELARMRKALCRLTNEAEFCSPQ